MLRHRFAAAGLLAVENRSWRALGHELYDHYLAAAGSSVLVTAA
jgi:hypothetical protein